MFKGEGLSKSHGVFVGVPTFLDKYDSDPLRFYLAATAPETRDTELALSAAEGFTWEDFVERNNNVLVTTWGNLCQHPRRAHEFMLSFATKRFDGRMFEPGDLDDEDRALLQRVEASFEAEGELYGAVKLRAERAEALAHCGPTGIAFAVELGFRCRHTMVDRNPGPLCNHLNLIPIDMYTHLWHTTQSGQCRQ
jgi:methionyl-tRNA synthetase